MKNGLLRAVLEGLDENNDRWVGFDLDGTIAYYDEWKGIEHIGEPIPSMIALIKKYLDSGTEVRIFTARASQPTERETNEAIRYIQEWSLKHIGIALKVTCEKDFKMIKLYDDKAVGVIENKGQILIAPET